MIELKNKVIRFFKDETNLFLLFLLFACTAFSCYFSMTGNDFWWHAKVGEWIVQNREIPRTAIFNWYDNEQPWTAHEWLFEVIIYKLHTTLGTKGLYFFIKILSAAATAIMLWSVKPYISNNKIKYCIYAVFITNQILSQFYPRPQFFSFFFIFITLKILNDYDKGEHENRIWLLPIIAVLWSNIHGGFALLSYAFPLLLAASHLFTFSYERVYGTEWDKKKLSRTAFVALLCIFGILVNPIGAEVLLIPYKNLFESMQGDYISEWLPPLLKIQTDLVFSYGMMFFMLMWMIISKKRINIWHALLCVVGLYLALKSRRFVSLFAIISAFAAAPYFCKETDPVVESDEEPTEDISTDNETENAETAEKKPKRKAWKKPKPILYVIESILFIGVIVYDCAKTIKDDDNNVIILNSTSEVVDWVRERQPQRLFNDYASGTDLIYNGIDVFIDARADCYAATESGMFADFINLNDWNMKYKTGRSGAETPEEILAYYDFDALIVHNKNALYYRLYNDTEHYALVEQAEPADSSGWYYFERIE